MAIEIRDVYGNLMPPIVFNVRPGTFQFPTLRISNEGSAAVSSVRLTVANKDWSYSGQINRSGQEVVSRKFVELNGSAVGGGVSALGDYAEVGPISAGSYVDVSAQIIVPADAQTRGKTSFIICGSAA